MTVRILHGDCRVVMATLPEASVDAIVCDPPYELGFMGKGWDRTGVANDVETWRQALRVLKPGGHLLAFSGTRTYHRMVCAIEDAGFEVRDQIGFLYGSGFPKSMNLDNLRGEKVCGCESSSERDVRPLHDADVSAPLDAGNERGQVLQPCVPEQGASVGQVQRAAAAKRGGESSVEGWRDAAQAAGQLCLSALCDGTGLGAADGAAGRLCDGAPARDGGMVRLPADADGGRPPRRSRPAEQRAEQPGTLAGQPEPQAGGAWPVCRGCGLPVLPRGLGTALKPAWEPVCVARRPLIGTVAANVLQHGTGALNIDGCRVEICDGDGGNFRTANGQSNGGFCHSGGYTKDSISERNAAGRWPANVIHDGSDEVLAAFPQDVTKSTGGKGAASGLIDNLSVYGKFSGENKGASAGGFGDTGTAARFFYTAKASAEDRHQGLTGKGNTHPTVKPTDLMRYLCRLVTPPGGVVLDPFAGSGSTLKAAELEGFDAIGIELDPAYIEIARARIAADAPLFADVEVA